MRSLHTKKSGFTLVEILIVVIILGILAAIVIPQFTNASTDARKNSLKSQMQTIRSAVELFKLQHGDTWPTADGTKTAAWDWAKLTGTSTYGGVTVGPYLQQIPLNPLNGDSAVKSQAADPADGDAAAATDGYVFSQATGKVFATDDTNKVETDY
jgi:general secretion pathway protein G